MGTRPKMNRETHSKPNKNAMEYIHNSELHNVVHDDPDDMVEVGALHDFDCI
jgi:hypothetical protein